MAVKNDSRKIEPGDTFVAISGSNADGLKFISEAIARGASKVVYGASRPPEIFSPGVEYIPVSDPYFYFAEKVREANGFPDLALDLYGVTGTNGKTTSVYLLRRLLGEKDCGMLTTVEYYDGGETMPSNQTTPDPERLFAMFRRMKENRLRYAAMELSSHALSQSRTGGVRFKGAVFTNFTGDHLDYHKTRENYLAAKKRLFLELLADDGAAVLNFDDQAVKSVATEITRGRVIGIGMAPDADYRIERVSCDVNGSSFLLNGREFSSNLSGLHNVYNLAGVLAVLQENGFDADDLQQKLNSPVLVPGRLEKIPLHNGANVFIDYAHTDDALKNILQTVRNFSGSGKLTVVFGCGGDRDRSKRPRMGKAAAEYADKIVVTSDNPRSETPSDIIDGIVKGIPEDFQGELRIEPDRGEAVKNTLAESVPGESIVIAGKGHENYQEINGVRKYFSDRDEILKNIRMPE